jgi:hypothetical protein
MVGYARMDESEWVTLSSDLVVDAASMDGEEAGLGLNLGGHGVLQGLGIGD